MTRAGKMAHPSPMNHRKQEPSPRSQWESNPPSYAVRAGWPSMTPVPPDAGLEPGLAAFEHDLITDGMDPLFLHQYPRQVFSHKTLSPGPADPPPHAAAQAVIMNYPLPSS